MLLSDIEAAAATGNQSNLRTAFKVLVEYPDQGSIGEAGSAEQLLHLLNRVSQALANDNTIMPNSTRERIEEVFAFEAGNDPSRHYNTAARAILDDMRHWQELYGYHLDKGDD